MEPPFSFQRHCHGNVEREDYVPKREGRTNSNIDELDVLYTTKAVGS